MKKAPSFFILASVIVGGMTLVVPQKASAAVVNVFDDFLFDNLQMPGQSLNGPANPMGFLEWQVTGGTVDLVGPPGPLNLLGRYVSLDGALGAPGLFSYALPLALQPLTPYTLRFLFNSVDGAPNTGRVNVLGQTFDFSSSTTEFAVFSREVTFLTLTTFLGVPPAGLGNIGDSPLTFRDLGVGSGLAGVGIDQIILIPTTQLASVLPEPGIPALLMAGSVALLTFSRRRRRNS